MRPSVVQQNVSPPAFGTLVLVPTEVPVRMVYGTVELLSTGTVDSFVRAEVETAPNSDAYDIVIVVFNALGLLQVTRRPFTFAVKGGRRYRFVKGNGAGVTEVVLHYSYVEF